MYLLMFFYSSLILNPIENASAHAVYVSVIEVEQGQKGEGEVRLKIFTNDLQDAIYNQTGHRLNLSDSPCVRVEKELMGYLNQHFKLSLDNNQVNLSLERCEINDMSIWIYLRFDQTRWRTINIHADYLMELFPTQTNVVSVKFGNIKRMGKMTNASRGLEFKL